MLSKKEIQKCSPDLDYLRVDIRVLDPARLFWPKLATKLTCLGLEIQLPWETQQVGEYPLLMPALRWLMS